MSTARATLDNPVFSGRFRDFGRGSHYQKPVAAVQLTPVSISDVTPQVVSRPAAVQPAMQRQSRSQVLQRTVTAKPAVTPLKNRRQLSSQKVMTAMAVVVFMAGVGVALQGLRTNQAVEAQVSSGRVQQAQAAEEDKPSQQAIANYRVDPTLPRYVRINKLSVFARVTRQGIDKNGALKAPANVHDVGWYENSSKPGEGGAMLLDSHVSGPTTKGAFHDLKKLAAGDEVEVERGDGQKFNFKVVKTVVSDADKTNMADALVSVETGKAGLNLITCTGAFDAATSSYKQRLIVFAVQI